MVCIDVCGIGFVQFEYYVFKKSNFGPKYLNPILLHLLCILVVPRHLVVKHLSDRHFADTEYKSTKNHTSVTKILCL
jgi:hypothetical protein